jgi:hypothetical protein
MRFMLPILIALTGSQAYAQTHLPPLGVSEIPTRISSIVTTGKIERRRAPQIDLAVGWSATTLVETLKTLAIHSPTLVLEVDRRHKSPRTERIAFRAFFRGLPILDRDLIMIVKDHKRIDSIDVNFFIVSSFDTVTLNEERTKAALNQYLSARAGTESLSISETPRVGWVALGQHLLPVAEYEVVDPVRLKHFTARMDLSSGQILGFKERTIN